MTDIYGMWFEYTGNAMPAPFMGSPSNLPTGTTDPVEPEPPAVVTPNNVAAPWPAATVYTVTESLFSPAAQVEATINGSPTPTTTLSASATSATFTLTSPPTMASTVMVRVVDGSDATEWFPLYLVPALLSAGDTYVPVGYPSGGGWSLEITTAGADETMELLINGEPPLPGVLVAWGANRVDVTLDDPALPYVGEILLSVRANASSPASEPFPTWADRVPIPDSVSGTYVFDYSKPPYVVTVTGAFPDGPNTRFWVEDPAPYVLHLRPMDPDVGTALPSSTTTQAQIEFTHEGPRPGSDPNPAGGVPSPVSGRIGWLTQHSEYSLETTPTVALASYPTATSIVPSTAVAGSAVKIQLYGYGFLSGFFPPITPSAFKSELLIDGVSYPFVLKTVPQSAKPPNVMEFDLPAGLAPGPHTVTCRNHPDLVSPASFTLTLT